MSHWYFKDRQRRQQGPVPGSTLVAMFQHGGVDSTTPVWREGLPGWQPLAGVSDELGLRLDAGLSLVPLEPAGADPVDIGQRPHPPHPPLPPRSTQAGRAPAAPESGHTTLDLRAPIAPAVRADNPSDLAGDTPEDEDGPLVIPTELVVTAGVLKRVAALLVDMAVALGLTLLALKLLSGLGLRAGPAPLAPRMDLSLMFPVVAVAYSAVFHACPTQATPGKMFIGIKVARPDGSRLGLLRALARGVATFLNGSITGGIGFLIAAFTARNQALHDMVCDTVVVDSWAFTRHAGRQRDQLGAPTLLVLVLAGLAGVAVVVLLAMVVATMFYVLFGPR